MATQRQIESARRNGAKSKGPVTAEGKARSSQNALKHGLAADPDIVMETENDDNYDRLLEAYISTYAPVTGEEYDLVCQVVSASWRLRRISRIEANLLDAEMNHHAEILATADAPASENALEAKAFRTLAYPGRSLALVVRYAASARRMYDAAVRTLRERQRERLKTSKQNEPDLAQPESCEQVQSRTPERVRSAKPLAIVPRGPSAFPPEPISIQPMAPPRNTLAEIDRMLK